MRGFACGNEVSPNGRRCLDQLIDVTSVGLTLFSMSSLVTRYQSSVESAVPKIWSTAVLPNTVVPEIR